MTKTFSAVVTGMKSWSNDVAVELYSGRFIANKIEIKLSQDEAKQLHCGQEVFLTLEAK